MLGGLPVSANHLDEVAEALAAGHRRSRKVAEDLPVGDALEDHLAGRVALAEHPAQLAEEAKRVRLGAAVAPNPLEDSRSFASACVTRASGRTTSATMTPTRSSWG